MEEFGGDNFFVKNWVDFSNKHFPVCTIRKTFFEPLCFVKMGPNSVSSAILFFKKIKKIPLHLVIFNLRNFLLSLCNRYSTTEVMRRIRSQTTLTSSSSWLF